MLGPSLIATQLYKTKERFTRAHSGKGRETSLEPHRAGPQTSDSQPPQRRADKPRLLKLLSLCCCVSAA